MIYYLSLMRQSFSGTVVNPTLASLHKVSLSRFKKIESVHLKIVFQSIFWVIHNLLQHARNILKNVINNYDAYGFTYCCEAKILNSLKTNPKTIPNLRKNYKMISCLTCMLICLIFTWILNNILINILF